MAKQTAILSIDGGGIRGIIPAMVLDYIEDRTHARVADLFDVIAGTSTGGILALGLTRPDERGKPQFTARALVDLYARDGQKIFPHELFGKLRQVIEEKYPADGLEEVLKSNFEDVRLREALTGVMVTAYDIERRQPIFFRSKRAKDSPGDRDFLMRDVARATSAAPTYFEPLRLAAEPPRADYTLVDGGVFANNPAMCAFVDAYAGKARSDQTLMVSLGTGVLTRALPYSEARRWGLAGWGRKILDVVFDGVSDTVDYQLAQILGDRYHRFQTKLERACDEMDDASDRNVQNLKLEGEELIETHTAELNGVCDKLIRLRGS